MNIPPDGRSEANAGLYPYRHPATADEAFQRRIWESRCPELLTICDRLADELAKEPRATLEPPYCQVVGRNAAVLLTREQIERIARDYGGYPVTADLACSIHGEMRRALIELDAAEGERNDG